MAWPDFTEVSFGYCFLRELETKYTRGGRFPKASDFISQHIEKTEGYDVEVAMDGSIPLFIPLKRSMVMTGLNAGELASPLFTKTPITPVSPAAHANADVGLFDCGNDRPAA